MGCLEKAFKEGMWNQGNTLFTLKVRGSESDQLIDEFRGHVYKFFVISKGFFLISINLLLKMHPTCHLLLIHVHKGGALDPEQCRKINRYK